MDLSKSVYIIYFYCFLFNLDYMVTKLKEDGLDNVHTEAAQVSVTSKKCNAFQLDPRKPVLSLYLSLYKACFTMFIYQLYYIILI